MDKKYSEEIKKDEILNRITTNCLFYMDGKPGLLDPDSDLLEYMDFLEKEWLNIASLRDSMKVNKYPSQFLNVYVELDKMIQLNDLNDKAVGIPYNNFEKMINPLYERLVFCWGILNKILREKELI